jgi:hypothetical protein
VLRGRPAVEQAAPIFSATQFCSAVYSIGGIVARSGNATLNAGPPVGAPTIHS